MIDEIELQNMCTFRALQDHCEIFEKIQKEVISQVNKIAKKKQS